MSGRLRFRTWSRREGKVAEMPYLSYTGFKTYKTCPLTYWNDYVNNTVLEKPDDRLGSIYGTVVGTLFERFYNEKIWRKPQPQAEVMALVDEV